MSCRCEMLGRLFLQINKHYMDDRLTICGLSNGQPVVNRWVVSA